MAIPQLFSRKQRTLRGPQKDTLSYEDLPDRLRVQIVHIIDDAIGEGSASFNAKEYYKSACEILRREYGVFYLNEARTAQDELIDFIIEEQDIERVLDAVGLMMHLIDNGIRNDIYGGRKLLPDDAISDLNQRFKESGIGYAYESGEIIRIDTTYTHSEIVKPTLSLLSDPIFANVNNEYLEAHEHYRHNRNRECLNSCNQAFESMMKVICHSNGWELPVKETAGALINVLFENKFIPEYLQKQITGLRNVLDSGITVIRNKESAHGQGMHESQIEDSLVRFALNLTGSTILYLGESK